MSTTCNGPSKPNANIPDWSSHMPFPEEQRQALLQLKGIGPTVIQRLEQLGFGSLQQLSEATALDIVEQAAALLGSSCWKNSPQARAAIQAAIDLARNQHAG